MRRSRYGRWRLMRISACRRVTSTCSGTIGLSRCSMVLGRWKQSSRRSDRMALTLDEVRKVALLSRLELDDDELERQTGRLNQLLDQFAKLQELDVTGVEPTSHSFPVFNVMRDDAARPSLPR